ncbi:MAG: DUF86 domain-containing protein [Methanomassiliicoccaceae archaeon]|nr:DUF86 domain-containing protein [Methanomassiliicoccaceae archaeon]
MHNDRATLNRIIEHCDEIQSFIDEKGNDIEDFLSSKIFQRACTQSIQLIGKNVKNLSDELTAKYSEIQWKEIAGMRDIIAHRYYTMNHIMNQSVRSPFSSYPTDVRRGVVVRGKGFGHSDY